MFGLSWTQIGIILLVGVQMGLELFVRPSDIFALAPGIDQ